MRQFPEERRCCRRCSHSATQLQSITICRKYEIINELSLSLLYGLGASSCRPQIIGTVITYELVMLDAVNDRGPSDQEACNGSIYSNLTAKLML